MLQLTRTAQTAGQRQFMPATHSLTVGIFSSVLQDVANMNRKCWHSWLDLCDELSYALAFYQEWMRRHRY
jgi:hypothetical protein